MTEIRVDVVVVDKDLLPIQFTDKKARSEFISAIQGLQKSEAWKYLRSYFVGMLINSDAALDTVGAPNDALVIAAKRSILKKVIAFPESMLAVADAHIRQELINEKKTQDQPKHPQAPKFGVRKKEK